MNIKSDPEVVQRWHTHHWIGNFEADLSMMVSRPYEANLGGENPKLNFSNSRKYFGSKIGRDRVETGFPQVEGVKPEAGEARRGPRRAK